MQNAQDTNASKSEELCGSRGGEIAQLVRSITRMGAENRTICPWDLNARVFYGSRKRIDILGLELINYDVIPLCPSDSLELLPSVLSCGSHAYSRPINRTMIDASVCQPLARLPQVTIWPLPSPPSQEAAAAALFVLALRNREASCSMSTGRLWRCLQCLQS